MFVAFYVINSLSCNPDDKVVVHPERHLILISWIWVISHLGHSIHLHLTLSSISAEWLGCEVACQTQRETLAVAALSWNKWRAHSAENYITHAYPKGLSLMLLAHIVAYFFCRKLIFRQKTVHNAWAHGHASTLVLPERENVPVNTEYISVKYMTC